MFLFLKNARRFYEKINLFGILIASMLIISGCNTTNNSSSNQSSTLTSQETSDTSTSTSTLPTKDYTDIIVVKSGQDEQEF